MCDCCAKITYNPRYLNLLVIGVSGFLFWTSWWIMIDAHSTNKALFDSRSYYYVPSIVATIAFFIIITVPISVFHSGMHDKNYMICCRLYLFFGFFMLFSAMIGASYICIHDFAMKSDGKITPGIQLFLHNFFIFSATFLYKFGVRTEDFY